MVETSDFRSTGAPFRIRSVTLIKSLFAIWGDEQEFTVVSRPWELELEL